MIGRTLTTATLLLLASLPLMSGTSAITVELAKKCQALMAEAFPPRVIGNPAAGSAKGSGKDAQAYFSKCVKNGGTMGEADSNVSK
ncbi:hypothetical protein [Bradyrhizobium erythrophlei]|jgi:hypothetical protein|uniref:PsiF repeat-containing protein n=1 Tax=Bradyrhizobium erythrophlei TaxID=1437360 RepID=A0A1M7SQT8_9BRAD|nr:hypothetical protein [Bradyrhizobium erythrophlei]SHN60829.1 hypothetical protein SAMN05444170_0043 [Bradyrhizobium erythrophlei]